LAKKRSHKRKKHEELPEWKHKVKEWNEHHLEWLEKAVEAMIPWLVLCLLIVIVSEFGHEINHYVFEKIIHRPIHILDAMAEVAHHHEHAVHLIDTIIILFFVVDLFFKFWKQATVWKWFRKYFLDILACTPMGVFMGGAGGAAVAAGTISEGQSITHAALESEKIVQKAVKVEQAVKVQKVAGRSTKLMRLVTRIPRLLRLVRLRHFFVKRKK